MTDTDKRTNPDFAIAHKAGLETGEFKKVTLAMSLAHGLTESWGGEQAWSGDFKRALADAVNAAYQQPTPETLKKLSLLEEKWQGVAAAAVKEPEERTREEQALLDTERQAADADQDGTVTLEEGMKRVYNIFKELGLDDQAQWFLNRQKARKQQ